MNPVILIRASLDEEGELEIAREVFGEDMVFEYRSQIPADSLVIGRYSVLPFYVELQKELKLTGSSLINSWSAHQYIANMYWLNALEGLTPETWLQGAWMYLPDDASFVVKGLTNSRKFQWNTHMFAETKDDVKNVVRRLMDDTMIREQGLVVRRYVPLRKFDEQINGLPVTNEWRFFCLDKKIISSAFYWSNMADELDLPAEVPEAATKLVEEALEKIWEDVRFVVVDVAETEEGSWIVVELNDGQMSGLSLNDPRTLYEGLLSLRG